MKPTHANDKNFEIEKNGEHAEHYKSDEILRMQKLMKQKWQCIQINTMMKL